MWAIVQESERTRRFHFVDKTTRNEKNQERAEVYCKFLEIELSGRRQRSEEFVKTLWGDEKLKRKCDNQIEMLNDLGLIIDRGRTVRKNSTWRFSPMRRSTYG